MRRVCAGSEQRAMVDAEVVRDRLRALEGYLASLDTAAKSTRECFVTDADLHDLAERRLHLAIECTIDAANQVIAAEGLRTAKTYRDAFLVLAEHGLIDGPLAQRLGGWAGLRNVLVHLYLDIDHGIVHDAISTDLSDLSAFADQVRAWLDTGDRAR